METLGEADPNENMWKQEVATILVLRLLWYSLVGKIN